MRRNLNPKAAALAGIVAGLVFIALEMALVAMVQGESPWAPPRMIAAIAMGDGVLPPPATFDAGIFVVALAVHFALSIVLAFILGWGISRFGLGLAAAVGAGTVFGLAVYGVNFYGFTAVFPWFAMARGIIGIFAHAAFGAVAGGVYSWIESQSAAAVATDAGQRV